MTTEKTTTVASMQPFVMAYFRLSNAAVLRSEALTESGLLK